MDKILAAAEALVAALKENMAQPAQPIGNRTVAVTDYDGDDDVQNVVDCLRRAIRYSREGKLLSKKERNVARQAIKNLKDMEPILNTNGHDFWTLNGL